MEPSKPDEITINNLENFPCHIQASLQIMSKLDSVCDELASRLIDHSIDHPFSTGFAPTETGNQLASEYVRMTEIDSQNPWGAKSDIEATLRRSVATIRVCFAYCTQALQEKERAHIGWSYTAEANMWLGVLCGHLGTAGIERKMALSERGRFAVSKRPDQALKDPWKEHVSRCVASGAEIKTIDSLLNIAGYPPEATKIATVTLKAWAKEAVPSIRFKAGRPTKK